MVKLYLQYRLLLISNEKFENLVISISKVQKSITFFISSDK